MASFDWTTLSRDPISPTVKQAIYAELRARQREPIFDKSEFIHQFVAGRSVLDIGVVEHSMNHVDNPDWLHGRMRGWARELVGVDILEPEIARLRERGFEVWALDATSERDLERRFECVVMGDIIEHVNDPVALLRFGARHLTPDGSILVTTPNPLYLAHLYESLRTGVALNNAEHIAYVAPTHALELARRAGLVLREYRQLQLPLDQAQTWAQRALFYFRDRFAPTQEIFAYAFVYLFSRAD